MLCDMYVDCEGIPGEARNAKYLVCIYCLELLISQLVFFQHQQFQLYIMICHQNVLCWETELHSAHGYLLVDHPTSQQVVSQMRRPELAGSELAGVWKPYSRVCMSLCIGALRLNWHCLLSLFSMVCLFPIAPILHVPISTLQWPNLYKCFVLPGEFLFCLGYLILPLL